MPNKEKMTKILLTLPASFDALTMTSALVRNAFEEIVNAESANIERRIELGRWNSESDVPIAHFSRFTLNLPYPFRGPIQGSICERGENKFHDRIKRKYGTVRTRHYYGKPGHSIKMRRIRIADGVRQKDRRHRHPNHHAFQLPNWGTRFLVLPSIGREEQHYSYNSNVVNLAVEIIAHPSNPFPNKSRSNPSAHLSHFETSKNFLLISHTTEPPTCIASGAYHCFFARRQEFFSFESMTEKSVQFASVSSGIMGKGKVAVSLGSLFMLDALDAPDF